jgi:hypothetical protein
MHHITSLAGAWFDSYPLGDSGDKKIFYSLRPSYFRSALFYSRRNPKLSNMKSGFPAFRIMAGAARGRASESKMGNAAYVEASAATKKEEEDSKQTCSGKWKEEGETLYFSLNPRFGPK